MVQLPADFVKKSEALAAAARASTKSETNSSQEA